MSAAPDARSWGRFVASLAALAAVALGIPAFLVVCARAAFGSANPVPAIGSPDELASWLERELSVDEIVPVVLRALLVVAWLLWASLVSSVVAAVVASRPGLGHVGIPAPRAFDGVASWIAAGLVVVSSLSSTSPASASPGARAPAIASASPVHPSATPVEREAGRGAPSGYAEVLTGESVRDVAERTLGDAGRWEDLWALRDEQVDPAGGARWHQAWRLEAGWLLRLPADGPSAPARPAVDDPAAGPDDAGSTHVVRPGESYWSIAADLASAEGRPAGDAELVARTIELRDRNAPLLGHDDPDLLHPGDVVRTDPGPATLGATVVVRPGDSYWSIALGALTAERGEIPTVEATHELTQSLVARNAGRLGHDDPTVLHPGDVVEVAPSPTVAGPAPAPAAAGPTDADAPPADAPPADTPRASSDQEPAPANGPTAVDGPRPDAGAPTSTDRAHPGGSEREPSATPSEPGPSGTTSPAPTETSPPVDDDTRGTAPTERSLDGAVGAAERAGAGDDATAVAPTPTTTSVPPPPGRPEGDAALRGATSAPSPIRFHDAALLAAGILTLVAVRRRRALRAALPHARVPTPTTDVATTERRLRHVDPGERAARIDVAVRAAAHQVAGTGAVIGSVRAALDGEIVVRFSDPVELGRPWLGDGATWSLPAAVPIELVADDARRVGPTCLALVAIGVDDDGRDVLLDVEAAGTTVVEAEPARADEVVRAVGAGLATSITSEVVHLVVARLGGGCLFGHPNSHRTDSVRRAIDLALELAGSTVANERSAFDLRARRTGGEMWEPAVVLLGTDDRADDRLDLGALPPPGHGLGLVVASAPGSQLEARARLVGDDRGWSLDAFGERLAVTPIGLRADDVASIAEVLDDAATRIEPAPAVALAERGRLDDDPGCDVRGDGGQLTPFADVEHEIVVSLLGGVSIADADGRPARFERSKTVELIAWLATHRDRATRSAARTALWEMDVRDATFANVVSEARRGLARLVDPPRGGEWLGRTLTDVLPLHEHVVTDAELVRARVEAARVAPPSAAIDLLRPAVELVGGLPFAGTSYLWPDADGITSELVMLSLTASAELAGHALSVGDTELVFWSTGRGLQVLPGYEELIGLRMRAHARSGDLAGVRQEWERYERTITADSWSDGEPAPKLLDLRRQLLSPGS